MERAPTQAQSFHPNHDPQKYEPILQHHKLGHIHGPISFFNPVYALSAPLTVRHAARPEPSAKPSPSRSCRLITDYFRPHEQAVTGDVQFKWGSRDNRKGRHTLLITPSKEPGKPTHLIPMRSSSLTAILNGVMRMFTTYPYWDVSYLVAAIFTIGSAVWVINSFFVWLPSVKPSTEFTNEILVGGGITAFIGATIFEFGSFFLVLEAINKHNSGCFGWALIRVLSEKYGPVIRFTHFPESKLGNHETDEKGSITSCCHHHSNTKNLVGRSSKDFTVTTATQSSSSPSESNSLNHAGPGNDKIPESGDFKWLPSWEDLRTHYIYELGFQASVSQLIGASIFWVSGFTALPGINNHLSDGTWDTMYAAPQIAGGSLFILSGALFTLETQKNWYTPAFKILGWHIGFWNFVGGIGFTLSGIFLIPRNNTGMEYQAGLSTFWGSWAFMVGSTIQWYESLDKYPVVVTAPEGE
ncbi:hypothetical protein FQN57_007283 [Myotisia sp. PD_48]|nr:hypothetical protein FQN57_007283 [Myotisia sp. PD_48]